MAEVARKVQEVGIVSIGTEFGYNLMYAILIFRIVANNCNFVGKFKKVGLQPFFRSSFAI